ncbi:hypothetical protein BGZ60DRAFT_531384 [Tricladium varicosporioides]|nr:hypothetical protein BGZ60DRAFT_531384 [Hymenoscyphus varicosporioides]
MSSGADREGSEDVNDFLQRIKELGDRRDQEDEERNRKLEEEILQGRKERQARRAERARSISPTKSSPANTPTTSKISMIQTPSLSQTQSPTIDPYKGLEAQRDVAVNDAMEHLTGPSTSPTKENSSPGNGNHAPESDFRRVDSIKNSPSNAMPSRNSPLSWQRRPNSQASDRPKSRPLSMVATENAARSPRATPEPSPPLNTEPGLSREQIAQSLATKDPAWFRQTADRGLSSPAYRRNQVEDEDRSDHGSSSSRVQMPGMNREGGSTGRAADDSADRSSSPSRSSNTFSSSSRVSHQSSPTVAGRIGSPMPLTSAQKLDPPDSESREPPRLAMSPSQGRISPERLDRPTSPTKGMGGFVQSAMMKRSDSVSKRWSVQSPPGLQRGNSVASNRSSHDVTSSLALGNIITNSPAIPRPSSLSRESSPQSPSRPSSSHSNATITQERSGLANSIQSSITLSTDNDGFVKPHVPTSRSQTPQGHNGKNPDPSTETTPHIDATPPSSPSKTMDPRRWSPTKSSWLESALNKPESPKPKPAAAPPQQPAWMSEINKAKQQKGSVDLGRSSTNGPKHEVNIGGLMRSPPPGPLAKPIGIGGLPSGFSPAPASKTRLGSLSSQDGIAPAKTTETRENAPPRTLTTKTPGADAKVKPETPPKKDFRANLKPRQPPPDNAGGNEPEFKNVFGQLRRTKTQNYVAPDELKNNITRGKAALNITGGPKKTERKDEFKEAILKKKEDFKKAQAEGKGVTRSMSVTSQDASLPEALVKRKALGSSATGQGHATSEALTRQVTEQGPSKPIHSEASAPSRLQGKEAIGGKLAGRFNPALAGLLARGPPSMASDTSRSSSPASSSQRTVSMSTSTTNPDVPDSGPQLTHMTKGRARGPRRKAPSSTPATDSTKPIESSNQPSSTEKQAIKAPLETAKSQKSPEPTPILTESADIASPISQPSSPRKLDMKRRSQFLQEAPNKSNKAEAQLDYPKPLSPSKKANSHEMPIKSPETKVPDAATPKTKPIAPIKSPLLSGKMPETIEKPPISTKPFLTQPSSNQPNVSRARDVLPEVPTEASQLMNGGPLQAPKSIKSLAAAWDKPIEDPSRQRSPLKPGFGNDNQTGSVLASPLRSPESTGSQFGASRPLPTPPVKAEKISPSVESRSVLVLPKSPTKSEKLSPSSPGFQSSLVPQASEASQLVDDFFGLRKGPPPEYLVDTTSILAARPDQSGANIKTLRSSLYQLGADGKTHLVPSHQERVLFEGNLYICSHTFGNTAGKKMNEVYFWVGDEVPDSVVDEARIFAQREAKSCSGKLITIRQGKENAEFFQALGGIIVIRRGTANKYDSLAPHILCGRKQFGQIAFDEVDFAPQSLCSGFPYLIATSSGKSYLWKGKGSGIEELSCARLIGMDFGLTGEIEEIEDGAEPVSFLNIFGGASISKSADHWKMKSNYNKYCCRLFSAGAIRNEQIVEVTPFCQKDLSSSRIYVLDAFFEIYIVVGSQAQSQYAAFHNALTFAQEYGILAASMEDRPFIPVSTVVIEGIPRDMKSVFRKWKDSLAPTKTAKPSTDLRRVRSLRVVPLNAAIEATR